MPDLDETAFPALLNAARRPYGAAVRRALEGAGFEDMPPRGAFVIGNIDRHGAAMQGMAASMGVSKQAVSQLVDTLVARGYLERAPEADDRRRVRLTLTARGREAARVARRAVTGVDRKLTQRIGAPAVATARQVLAALTDL